MGYGRRRGGYVCHCKNRFRYPRWLSPPFQGEDVERATEYEYKNNFECFPDQRKFYNEQFKIRMNYWYFAFVGYANFEIIRHYFI
jgi:hypothetical protein